MPSLVGSPTVSGVKHGDRHHHAVAEFEQTAHRGAAAVLQPLAGDDDPTSHQRDRGHHPCRRRSAHPPARRGQAASALLGHANSPYRRTRSPYAASRSRIHAEPRLTFTLSDCSHGRSIIRPLIANSTSTGRPRHPGNVSRGTARILRTRSVSLISDAIAPPRADPHADLGMTADVGGSGTLGAGGVLPPLTGDSALYVGGRGIGSPFSAGAQGCPGRALPPAPLSLSARSACLRLRGHVRIFWEMSRPVCPGCPEALARLPWAGWTARCPDARRVGTV